MKITKMFRRRKNNLAVSAVIGVILMVAVTVAMAAVVYAYNSGLFGNTEEVTPAVVMTQDNENHVLQVTTADPNLDWSNIQITGTATKPTGPIKAGDMITGCIGEVSVSWIPTNTLYQTYTFT